MLAVTPPPANCTSTVVLLRKVMEEWGYVDECELQNWKGGVVCMTCQHFIYGVDQHCHTMELLQPQAAATPTGSAPEEALQALDADSAQRDGTAA